MAFAGANSHILDQLKLTEKYGISFMKLRSYCKDSGGTEEFEREVRKQVDHEGIFIVFQKHLKSDTKRKEVLDFVLKKCKIVNNNIKFFTENKELNFFPEPYPPDVDGEDVGVEQYLVDGHHQEKVAGSHDDPKELLKSGDVHPNPGPGYEAKFVHALLKRHECPICLYAMRNPVQTECGHLFCKDCLDPVLKRRRPICPLDKEEITQDGIFPDNACRREILNLEVYCNYVAGGCQWVGHLKDLEAHLESCEHREIQCRQCGQYIQAVSLKAHQEVECPMRPEECDYCHQEMPSQQMEDHIKKVCPHVLHKCPNGCNSKLEFKLPELQRHLDIIGGDCPLSEVPCPYAIYGCSFVSLRKNLPTHMDQYQVYHVQIQGSCFMEMKSSIEKQASTFQHLMERVGSLESRTKAIERPQDAIEQRVELLDERREIKRVDELQRAGTSGTGINFSTVSSGYATDVQPATSSHLLGLGGAVGGGASQQRVDALQGRVVEVEHGINRAYSCLDQELRIQLLEHAMYNGVLVWKIDEFERRLKEAIDGTTMSLYSTPFYTSRHGYKMCCRIYLNGDGLGKGTRLSFFFVITRGPFDDLLDWPFKQKPITLTPTLLNQSSGPSVGDSFCPDAQSSSLLYPLKNDMNIASGSPIKFNRLLAVAAAGG